MSLQGERILRENTEHKREAFKQNRTEQKLTGKGDIKRFYKLSSSHRTEGAEHQLTMLNVLGAALNSRLLFVGPPAATVGGCEQKD